MSHHWPGILVVALLACLVFSTAIQAQDFREGYVITNNGDSITGLVSYSAGNKNLARCTFKATRKSDVVYYSPAEVESYGFVGDKNLYRCSIQTKPFLKKKYLLEFWQKDLLIFSVTVTCT